METLINSGPLILRGLLITLEVSALVLVIGTLIGILGGLSLLYGAQPLRWLARLYVDTLRGIPLLVLIFSLFYGLPLVGVRVNAITAGVMALSIFCGAHVSEVIRGGVNSIPQGQTDAANALGLTFAQRLRYVIFPQALRRILPPWVNTAAEMVKASSLVSLVSVVDLMLAIQQIAGRTRETLLLYAVAALLYFAINYTISRFGRRLEKRFTYA
ncbi:MAG: amino acid ABC transporter permease [Acidobacteriales bacterium]|nr:amino acid ABC transporter permease [Terriglobales bacterium]